MPSPKQHPKETHSISTEATNDEIITVLQQWLTLQCEYIRSNLLYYSYMRVITALTSSTVKVVSLSSECFSHWRWYGWSLSIAHMKCTVSPTCTVWLWGPSLMMGRCCSRTTYTCIQTHWQHSIVNQQRAALSRVHHTPQLGSSHTYSRPSTERSRCFKPHHTLAINC